MKIQEKDGMIINVFAIYWFDDRTYFYGFPKSYKGLLAYKESEVTVIEPEFTGRLIYFEKGIFHWALIKEQLLDDLLERDETAYNRFLKIIKEEELVDPDFY